MVPLGSSQLLAPPPVHPSRSSRSPSPSLSVGSGVSSVDVLSPSQSTDTLDVLSTVSSEDRGCSVKEEGLSEQELRRLYDDEEIDRFLGLFADYVSEVTMPPVVPLHTGHEGEGEKPNPEDISWESDTGSPTQHDCDDSFEKTGECDSLADSTVTLTAEGTAQKPHSLSEIIALTYLLPHLPPARPRPERFTLGRLRLTVQKLYLVAQPAYEPFFTRLVKLSAWTDRKRSAIFCTVFWMLWFHNLLLPALFMRILYSLVRRNLFGYPSLAELREHRREVADAEEFGEHIQSRLGPSSSSSVMEAWRLFRVFVKPKKAKVKQARTKAKQMGKDKVMNTTDSSTDDVSMVDVPAHDEEVDDATVLDDTEESQDEKDSKRAVMVALNEVADLHERIKNIFLWRRPKTSRLYTAVFTLLLFVSYLLPAQYLVKLVVFIFGVIYWHIVPIIVALPPADRSRLPPIFGDAPTDADYAMELISQRVARGESVRPPPRKPRKHKKNASSPSLVDVRTSSVQVASNSPTYEGDHRQGEVDWKKWGRKAASMKAWADQSKRWIGGERQSSRNSVRSGSDQTFVDQSLPSSDGGVTSTFLAQHSASPGIITITSNAIVFTPITSSKAKVHVLLEDIRGVKKSGSMKGLVIRWQSKADTEGKVEEERFGWVGGRDELFARLVGWGGRRWLKV